MLWLIVFEVQNKGCYLMADKSARQEGFEPLWFPWLSETSAFIEPYDATVARRLFSYVRVHAVKTNFRPTRGSLEILAFRHSVEKKIKIFTLDGRDYRGYPVDRSILDHQHRLLSETYEKLKLL